MTIREFLKQKRLLTDGAMGTYYALKKQDDLSVVEYANHDEKSTIEAIHLEYIHAGADLIRTNTFAANQSSLKMTKKEQEELLRQACQIAKDAIKKSNRQVFLAGDIGPIPESFETQSDKILDEYKIMIDLFVEEGVDAILFETFSEARYFDVLTKYIKDKNKDIFVLVNFSLNKNGYTKNGISAAKLINELAVMDSVDSIGFNCGIGSGHMYQVLSSLTLPKNKYVMAAANAGYPEQYESRTIYMNNPQYFAENSERIAELGVAILGACCGTTPKYIEETKKYLVDKKPVLLEQKEIETSDTPAWDCKKDNYLWRLLHSGKKVVAVELDPPYDADDTKLLKCAEYAKKKQVDILTLADSPMGRSRIDSILMSIKLKQVTRMQVMPHVCCRDKNMIAMRSQLLGAYIHGIRNLLVVTGDPVPDGNRLKTTGVFDYNSIRLMEYMKEMNQEHFHQEPMVYGGAFDPGVSYLEPAITRMQKKIAAGAQFFLTQPIYSDEAIDKIKEVKNRIQTKILCGIMPFVSYNNANFIKNEFTGIQVPDEIVARYHQDMSREEAENVGAQIANEIMQKLAPYADGFYLMLPFNRVSLLDKLHIPKE